MTTNVREQIDEHVLRGVIAAQLRRLREERGVSQKEAADGAGIGQQTLSQAENGLNTLSLVPLLRLCRYYRVKVRDLTGVAKV